MPLRPALPAQEILLEFPGGQGPCVIKALGVEAAFVEQRVGLRLHLHALGHTGHIPAGAEAQDIPHQRTARTVAHNVADEAAVELDGIEVHVGEQGKVGIAAAEIIEPEAQPEGPERPHDALEGTCFHIQGGFGDLYLHKLWGQGGIAAQNGQHRARRGGAEERVA